MKGGTIMGILALVLGILGALCAVMGIIIATEAVSLTIDASAVVDWMFWLMMSGILFLACIATALSRRE
jgi:hypothetical protein